MITPRIPHIAALRCLLTAVLLWLGAADGRAQFDVLTVEAMIAESRSVGGAAFVRSFTEQALEVVHSNNATTTANYLSINGKLDKYIYAFNVIQLITSSVGIYFNGVRTCNEIKDRIQDYKGLMEVYVNRCLKHGDIYSSDSIIYNNFASLERSLSKEVKGFYESVSDLYLAVSARAKITDFISMTDAINESLVRMRTTVNSNYYNLFNYVMLRCNYFKPVIFQAKNKEQILSGALTNWATIASKQVEF